MFVTHFNIYNYRSYTVPELQCGGSTTKLKIPLGGGWGGGWAILIPEQPFSQLLDEDNTVTPSAARMQLLGASLSGHVYLLQYVCPECSVFQKTNLCLHPLQRPIV